MPDVFDSFITAGATVIVAVVVAAVLMALGLIRLIEWLPDDWHPDDFTEHADQAIGIRESDSELVVPRADDVTQYVPAVRDR